MLWYSSSGLPLLSSPQHSFSCRRLRKPTRNYKVTSAEISKFSLTFSALIFVIHMAYFNVISASSASYFADERSEGIKARRLIGYAVKSPMSTTITQESAPAPAPAPTPDSGLGLGTREIKLAKVFSESLRLVINKTKIRLTWVFYFSLIWCAHLSKLLWGQSCSQDLSLSDYIWKKISMWHGKSIRYIPCNKKKSIR